MEENFNNKKSAILQLTLAAIPPIDILYPGAVAEEPGLVLLALLVQLDDLGLQAVHLHVQVTVVGVHRAQVLGQLLLLKQTFNL